MPSPILSPHSQIVNHRLNNVATGNVSAPADVIPFFNFATHNGEVTYTFPNNPDKKTQTYRAYTENNGQRVIQEKRTKRRWSTFGNIAEDGAVMLTRTLQRDYDAGAPYAAKYAAKVELLNDENYGGGQFHVTGRCCRCNRKLTNGKSMMDGFGPECAKHMTPTIAVASAREEGVEVQAGTPDVELPAESVTSDKREAYPFVVYNADSHEELIPSIDTPSAIAWAIVELEVRKVATDVASAFMAELANVGQLSDIETADLAVKERFGEYQWATLAEWEHRLERHAQMAQVASMYRLTGYTGPNTPSQVDHAIAEADAVEAHGGTAEEADDKFDEVMAVGAVQLTDHELDVMVWATDELDARMIEFGESWVFLKGLETNGLLADRTEVEAAINERFGVHQVVALNGLTWRYQRHGGCRRVYRVCDTGLNWSVSDEDHRMVVNFVEHDIVPVQRPDLSWLDDDEDYPVFMFDAIDMYDLTPEQLDELIEEHNGFSDKKRLLEDNPTKLMSRLLDINKGVWGIAPPAYKWFAGLPTQESARSTRGMVIAQDGGVAYISNNLFRVRSQSNGGAYTVRASHDDAHRTYHCDCKDRDSFCKHVYAVMHTHSLFIPPMGMIQVPDWAVIGESKGEQGEIIAQMGAVKESEVGWDVIGFRIAQYEGELYCGCSYSQRYGDCEHIWTVKHADSSVVKPEERFLIEEYQL